MGTGQNVGDKKFPKREPVSHHFVVTGEAEPRVLGFREKIRLSTFKGEPTDQFR